MHSAQSRFGFCVGRALPVALALSLALSVLTLSWLPGAFAPYQYDDYVTPLKDPASQSLSSLVNAIPRTLRPLTKLTYAAESSAAVTSAPGRRAFNLAAFVACAALLAALCSSTGLPFRHSLALATLWACHPVHAETVIALAGRSALLCLLFSLASALAMLHSRPAMALACAVLALLARETALPWLIVSATWVARRQGFSRLQQGLAAGASVLWGGVLIFASSRMRELIEFAWSDPNAWNRLGLQWAALPKGTLMLLIEPSAFVVDIEFAATGALRLLYITLAVGMYSTGLWLALRSPSSASVRVLAWLWLCLALPLHSVFPKLDPLTARSFSVSSASLVALLAAGLARGLTDTALARGAFWCSVCVCVVLLLPITRANAQLYRDPIALWREAAAQSRASTRPLINFATLLAQSGTEPGNLEQARAALERAVRRNPSSTEARERLRAVHALIETRKLLANPKSHATVGDHGTLPD